MNIFDIVRDDDVSHYTSLGEKAYDVKPFEYSNETLDAFNDLPLDPYSGDGRGALSQGKHRYRRYDDFRMTYSVETNVWESHKLPHRPFIQSPKFNKAVGGIARHLPELKITYTGIRLVVQEFWV